MPLLKELWDFEINKQTTKICKIPRNHILRFLNIKQKCMYYCISAQFSAADSRMISFSLSNFQPIKSLCSKLYILVKR